MKISVVSIWFDILMWQLACSVVMTALFIGVSLEDQHHPLDLLSITTTVLAAVFHWMLALILVLTTDLLLLPPVFALVHVACGVPYS